jgi:hypothetical protein
MLFFASNEVVPQKAGSREKCVLCCDRVGTWWALVRSEKRDKELVCAHCLLYRPESAWGHGNRHQLLYIGRFCRQVAQEYGNSGPQLDERGRLCPEDAEKLVLGVSVTSKLMSQKMGVSKTDPFTETDE